jgi:hypothetical protein
MKGKERFRNGEMEGECAIKVSVGTGWRVGEGKDQIGGVDKLEIKRSLGPRKD